MQRSQNLFVKLTLDW